MTEFAPAADKEQSEGADQLAVTALPLGLLGSRGYRGIERMEAGIDRVAS